MPDDPGPGGEGSAVSSEADEVAAFEPDEVEVYETDEGVVLYDAGNPLAWIESCAPVRLDDAA